MKAILTMCFIFTLVFLLADPGFSATIRVPADYATIQEAVVAAAADGDTILVAPGTYSGPVYVSDKVLTLRSDADGDPDTYDIATETTIIDGGGLQPVIFYSDSGLDGFTIQNGASAPYGGGIFLSFCGNAIIKNCTVAGNPGHGIYAELGAGTISNCVVTGNGAVGIGCKRGRLTIENCSVNGNDGGGIAVSEGMGATITNCTITGNQGSGGIWSWASLIEVTNSTIIGNRASQGGGIHNYFANSATVTNCTISANSASDGGGIYNFGWMTVTNTILWGDTAPFGAEIYNDAEGSLEVAHSDVQGGQPGVYQAPGSTLTWGEGNIAVNPAFAGTGNYHLGPFSPCIDKGDNAVPGLPATDLDGNPRVVDGNNDGVVVVDMGAYELQPAAAWGAASTFPASAELAGNVEPSRMINSLALFALPLGALLLLRRRSRAYPTPSTAKGRHP